MGKVPFEPRLVDVRHGNFLYRGPRPQSASDLYKLGCRTIINLQSGVFEFLHDDAYENEHKTQMPKKMHFRSLPLGDILPPTRFEIRAFLSMVDIGLDRGNVYFHCLHGVDRTGFMAACYRIDVQGWSPDDAIKEMLGIGFHKFPYWFWTRSLRYR